MCATDVFFGIAEYRVVRVRARLLWSERRSNKWVTVGVDGVRGTYALWDAPSAMNAGQTPSKHSVEA